MNQRKRFPPFSSLIHPPSSLKFMREWIALNMTPGIGPRAAAKLLERFGSPTAVFGALRVELEQLKIRPEAVESIMTRNLFGRAETELERVRALGGDILLLDDGVYPELPPWLPASSGHCRSGSRPL